MSQNNLITIYKGGHVSSPGPLTRGKSTTLTLRNVSIPITQSEYYKVKAFSLAEGWYDNVPLRSAVAVKPP